MKSKVFSKVVMVAMAVVMLFSVAFFGAGACSQSDYALLYRIAEMERRIEELEDKNQRLIEESRNLEERLILLEHYALLRRRASAAAELVEYAGYRKEYDFTQENWVTLQGHVAAGVEAINTAKNIAAVESVLLAAKRNIRSVASGERADCQFKCNTLWK